MTTSTALRIAIAESSVIIRKGIIAVLKQALGGNINFFEINTPEQLNDTLKNVQPDFLILNPLFIPFTDIITNREKSHTKFIALQLPLTDKSFLSMYDGIISLSDDINEISKQFQTEPQGIDDSTSETEALSAREKEIIVCVVKSMTNKEIADKLFISVHTVITHRRNISRKLEIHSTAGLTIYAIINKLVDISEIG